MTTIPVINNVHPFDARGVAKRFRHAAIFGALQNLHAGETMRFVNDHDPLPLLAQLRNAFGEGLWASSTSGATPARSSSISRCWPEADEVRFTPRAMTP
jgi:uncharacterized protein (DUF2249 family)